MKDSYSGKNLLMMVRSNFDMMDSLDSLSSRNSNDFLMRSSLDITPPVSFLWYLSSSVTVWVELEPLSSTFTRKVFSSCFSTLIIIQNFWIKYIDRFKPFLCPWCLLILIPCCYFSKIIFRVWNCNKYLSWIRFLAELIWVRFKKLIFMHMALSGYYNFLSINIIILTPLAERAA